MERTFPDHHCVSTLDPSAGTFTMNIRYWIIAPTTYTDILINPPVTYNCTPVTPNILQNFKAAFEDSVRRHWHLKHWLQVGPPDSRINPLHCGVQVEFTAQMTQAHLRLRLLCDPVPAPGQPATAFRSFCFRAGRRNVHLDDMVLAFPANGAAAESAFSTTRANMVTSDRPGGATYVQNTAAHEFGHYLGLNHRCFTPATSNAAADYCSTRAFVFQDDIMAVGNTVTVAHAVPWQDRLPRHHHHNDRVWMASRGQQIDFYPGLSDSLAGL